MKLFLSGAAFTALALCLPAQGQYDLFGNGCAGNGGFCFGHNPQGATYTGTSLPNEYAYPATSPTAMTVVGFNLYVQSNLAGPATVVAALYREDPANPGTPSTTPAAVGTLTAGTAVAFYPVMLDQPVAMSQNENFWIAAESINVKTSATSGAAAPGPIYWRRPPQGGTTWSTTGLVANPAYQIVCTTGSGTGAIPFLFSTTTPQIGQTFTVHLANATPNAPAFLFYGVSDTTWNGQPLPFDLTSLGFPGCMVFISLDVGLTATTTASGNANSPFPIPNVPSLIGSSFFNQWFVLDVSANTVNGSNAAKGTIG